METDFLQTFEISLMWFFHLFADTNFLHIKKKERNCSFKMSKYLTLSLHSVLSRTSVHVTQSLSEQFTLITLSCLKQSIVHCKSLSKRLFNLRANNFLGFHVFSYFQLFCSLYTTSVYLCRGFYAMKYWKDKIFDLCDCRQCGNEWLLQTSTFLSYHSAPTRNTHTPAKSSGFCKIITSKFHSI